MSVSKLLPAGGANDFNLNLGGTYTVVTLTKEYSSGSYSITSGNNDTTLDIYAYNTDGTLAGYTSTKAFTATKGFNKIIILGGQAGDVLGFSYKTTYTTSSETAETTAGPFITSVSTTTLSDSASTVTITGGNFATNITATWSSASTSSTYTSAVTRTSATTVTVTRGNSGTLIAAYNPWTLTLSNPGVNNPVGSSVHQYSFSMGSTPVWTTAAGSLGIYSKNTAFSYTLTATDADSNPLTYTLQSGSLPTGLSLSSSGVISGTPTTGTTALYTFTVRVTDTGGNFADRTFTLSDSVPTWVTTGTLTDYGPSSAYSYQLQVTDDDGGVTFALASGSLPTGLSLSSGGLISGAAYTGTSLLTNTFTVNATDSAGNVVTSGTLTIKSTFFPVGASFTFTTAGTTGRNGPSLATCQSAYSATPWTQLTSNLNMTTNGIQRWTVPASGTYSFTVAGARGGSDSVAGGQGRIVTGSVSLTAGEVLNIVCGQPGYDTGNANGGGGGGGGTFVYTGSSTAYSSTDLIFAAGGGSGGNNGNAAYTGQDGLASNSSSGGLNYGYGNNTYIDGVQTSLGYGGVRASHNNYGASGGAGFLGNGADGFGGYGYPVTGSGGWVGGPGGPGATSNFGGFGGGGGATQDCGGSGAGGGYTGGGGASCYTVSGAGGSNYGTRVTSGTFGSTNNGSGYVTVTRTA